MTYIRRNWISTIALLVVACSGTPQPLELTLTATDIAYDVSNVSGQVGQTVNIDFVNQGALEHNFIIDEFGVENLLQSGESATVSFTLQQVGKYEYYCNVAGHLEAGMKGTLTVTD